MGSIEQIMYDSCKQMRSRPYNAMEREGKRHTYEYSWRDQEFTDIDV